jgi:di/tricarboxylate transporter
MNPDILIISVTLLTATVLFVTNFIRNDLVALLVMLTLMLSGILTVGESLAGFSDPVVMIVASMFIIGEAIVHTGIARRVGEFIIRWGGTSETRLMSLLMAAAGILGSFVSSTATTAIFIPVTMVVTEKTGLNPRRLLMPLSVGALISGMMTLIATTSNIVINTALSEKGIAPFSFFSFTPYGVLVMFIAIIFMVLAGRDILARKTTTVQTKHERTMMDMASEYGLKDQVSSLRIPAGSRLIDRAVARLQLIRKYGLKLLVIQRVEKGRNVIRRALPETVFRQGDNLLLIGDHEKALELAADYTLDILQVSEEEHKRKQLFLAVGMVEVMLTPNSSLIGHSLNELRFQSSFNCLVLAIRRKGEPITRKFEELTLQFGDVLLVSAEWKNIIKLTDYRDRFLLLTMPGDYREVIPGQERAPVVLVILIAMVALMALQLLPVVTAAMLSAMALILTKCIRLDAMYKVINWQSLVLIAGILPIVTALNKSGAANLISEYLVQLMGPFGPVPILALLFAVTSATGLILSAVPTAVLIAPIAINTALSLGIPPQASAMTVAIACCAGFASPLSSPVNLLIQESGGYSFFDFVKIGIPLQLLTLIVTVVMAWYIYLL